MDGDADSKFSRRPGCSNRSGSLDRHRLLASGSPSGPRRSRPNFAQRINFAEPQMNDVRFAFRKLRQSPAFTFIAIVTLALGIGLNTVIFSLINDLFLRPLPFKDPERLVHMYSNARERNLLELPISAGRLKPGMTLGQARAALPSLEQSYRAQHPDKIDSSSVMTLKTLPEDTTGNLRPAFATLLAAVAFVLLIACSNVANLLLVRFAGRRREIALRMAIGASRASIVRLFVFESLLVSAIAGAAGALLAWQLVPIVPKMAANFLPFDPAARLDLSVPVLLFTIGLSILTGIVMGIYPALQSSWADLVDALKEGGRGTSGSVHQQRFRKILIGAQVALSVTLLAGAALLITSFVRLSQQNIGFHAENRWIGFITLPEGQYPDRSEERRFVEKTLAALHTVPAFESATISADIPLLAAAVSNVLYARRDREVLPIDRRAAAVLHNTAADYFKTWGIPILAGRDFDEHDTADRQNVIIISKAGAEKVFGDENPIGKTLLVGSASVPCEIIGIAGDVRSRKVSEPDAVEIYRPWAQQNFPFPCILVRSQLKPDAVTKLAQSALATVDPGLAIAIPQSMDAIVA